MDPQPLAPADWAMIARAIDDLVVFVALTINAAFAVLLGWAILPSLAASGDIRPEVLTVRRVLLPIGLVSAGLMLVALARGFGSAIEVASRIYPRGAL